MGGACGAFPRRARSDRDDRKRNAGMAGDEAASKSWAANVRSAIPR